MRGTPAQGAGFPCGFAQGANPRVFAYAGIGRKAGAGAGADS